MRRVLLLIAALLPPAASAAAEEMRIDAPSTVEMRQGGSAQVPITTLLQVDATGCGHGVTVPVVVSAEASEGMHAAMDRVESVLAVEPGERGTLVDARTLRLSGAPPGVVRVDAHVGPAPASCLGLDGAAATATHHIRVDAPHAPDEGGTRPIALRESEPVPLVLLVVLAAAIAALAWRAWPARGA